jgi:hypothetical protein
VVYEYGHLVFAGHHTLTAPGRPLDNLIQDAFLLNCRKLAEFFGRRRSQPDIKAVHYCTARHLPIVPLITWTKWGDAIDQQIAHMSYRRVTQPKRWLGHDGTNAALLSEFQAGFRFFLSHVDPMYSVEFKRCLDERSDHLRLPLP